MAQARTAEGRACPLTLPLAALPGAPTGSLSAGALARALFQLWFALGIDLHGCTACEAHKREHLPHLAASLDVLSAAQRLREWTPLRSTLMYARATVVRASGGPVMLQCLGRLLRLLQR